MPESTHDAASDAANAPGECANTCAPSEPNRAISSIGSHIASRRGIANRGITRAETSRRTALVAELVIAGSRGHDVLAWSMQTDVATGRPWNVTLRACQKMVARAYAYIADDCERNRDKLMGRHVAQRQAIYRQAMAGGDYGAALAAAKDEAALQGLYPKEASAPAQAPVQINLIAESVRQAAADPRYVAWLESQAMVPVQLERGVPTDRGIDVTPLSKGLELRQQAPVLRLVAIDPTHSVDADAVDVVMPDDPDIAPDGVSCDMLPAK